MIRISLTLVVGWVLAVPLLADDPPGDVAQNESLQFRRYLIPQSEVPERIHDGYMPIQRERFERMLEEINASSTTQTAETRVRIERATYRAELKENQLVAGTAELEILRTSDTASVLSLDPCGLALGRPIWVDDSSSARLGVDPTGQLVLLADRSGTLQFTWSLRGERDKRGRIAFSLELPRSAMNRMILDLPASMKPTVDAGFTEPASRAAAPTDTVGDGPSASMDGEPPLRRKWSIEMGGNNRGNLVIGPETMPLSQRQLVLARQSVTYGFREAGLELRAQLTLDVHHQPLDRLELDIHPSLQIISARLGETDMPVRSVNGRAEVRRIALDLPQPILGNGREVVLRAFAPLETEHLWRLPFVRPAGTVWQQGNATLEVPQGLVLKRLITESCVETSVEPMPAPLEGETRNLVLYEPDASVKVLLDYEPPQVTLDCGTSIRLNENLISGRLVAHIKSSRGSVFQLDARSLDGWIIDRVETVPAEALAGYTPRRARQVRIRLDRALQPGREIRVVVTAHRRLPLSGPAMKGSDFRILDLGRVPRGREFMSIHAEPPYHLTVSGDAELPHVSIQDLNEQDRELIETPPGAFVYRDGPAAQGLSVGLRREDPRYSATIAVRAIAEGPALKQTYVIRCLPSASRVARLSVRFSRAGDGSTAWQLLEESDDGLTAVRRDASDTTGHGETWEINLHRPRSEPFEIRATHSVKLDTEASLSLASLPEATSQEATLEVGTSDGTSLSVRADNLKSVPVPTDPHGPRYPLTRAMYRYDPSRDAAAVVARAPSSEARVASWIWSARLVSRWETHGAATHEAFFFLENMGKSHVVMAVPENVSNVRCTVQDEEAYLSKSTSPRDHQYVVRLPQNVRYPTVRVTFSTEAQGLGITSKLSPEWPELNIPCFEKIWSVWLPPGFTPAADDRLIRSSLADAIRWDQRLFGRRILRESGQPFNLLSASDWRDVTRSLTHKEPNSEAVRFVQTLETLRDELGQQAGNRPTWSDLITAYERAREAESKSPRSPSLPALFVDGSALRRLEITPHTALPDREIAPELPRSLHLAIIATKTEILLTSENAIGNDGQRLQPSSAANVATVRDAASILGHLRTSAIARAWMPARQWIEAPPLHLSPWPEARQCETLGMPLAGWSHCQLHVGLSEKRPLTVCQPRTLKGIGWGILLMVAGCIGWFVQRRPLILLLVLATSGAVALICPALWIPVARGAFLGALVGTAFVLVKRPVRPSTRWSESETTDTVLFREHGSSRIVTPIVLAALITGGFATGSVHAQVPVAEEDSQRQAFPLLVPVDDDRQPTGDYYFLPRPFYEAIHRRSAAASVSPRDWLLHSAMYRVRIVGEGEENAPSVEIVAEFDLEVFQADTRVQFPFGQGGIRLIEATLDGQAIETRWEPDGSGLILDVETRRRFQLTLTFRPLVPDEGVTEGFDLAIPRVARSLARIKYPNGVAGIEVLTAHGSVSRDAVQGEVNVELGPTSTLSVRWPKPEQVGDSETDVEVRELFLLRAQPNSVVLDAHFRFAVRAGSLREIQLVADPRLRLLPLPPNQPQISRLIEDAETQTLRLELDRPYDDEVTFRASFLLHETRGIGNLAIPRIQAVANRRLPAWLGVWTAAGLEVQVSSELQATSAEITDFEMQWPDVTPMPQRVFRMPLDEQPRILTIQPGQPRTEVSQEMDLSVGVDRGTITLRALLTLEDGRFLQRTLTVPPGFRVKEVHVTRDGEDRVRRWANDENGNLAVFFDRPVNGEHSLLLRGEVLAPNVLPDVFVQDAVTQSYEIRVFRQPGVQVAVQKVAGMQEDATVVTEAYHEGLGRLVAAYKANTSPENPRPSARLRVTPNRPATSGSLVTTLDFVDDHWQVNVDLDLRIAKGFVDSIRFDIPHQLAAALTLEPDLPREIQETSNPDRRIVLARPTKQLRGNTLVRLQSNWHSPEGERTWAPDIRVRDVRSLERFLVVPTRLGRQQIAWETSGLQSASLPQAFANGEIDIENKTVYQVVGPRMEATVRDVNRATGAPQIHLTDILLSWHLDGNCYGVTTFDLEPARLTEVELAVPQELDLIQVTVAGLPATLQRLENGNWRVPLGPEQLPQRIEVLFNGKQSLVNPVFRSHRFEAPILVGLPVTQTLWSVQGPPTVRAGHPRLAHAASNPLSLSRIRAGNADTLLNSASEIVAQSATKEMDTWRSAWQRRLENARQQIQRIEQVDPPASDAGDLERGPLEEPSASSLNETRAYDPASIWQLQQEQLGAASYGVLLGSSNNLRLDYASAHLTDIGRRGLMATALFGLVALVVLARRNRAVNEWALRWPYVAGVLSGIAWWLWCLPSVLGLVIILVSVVGAFRPAWATR